MPITTLPPAPEPTDSTSQFNAKSFAWVAALDQFTTEANDLAVSVNNDKNTTESIVGAAQVSANAAESSASNAAISASAALTHASAAAANTNAPLWVSGTTYAAGALVYSAVDGRTYRRKTAGGGTTNPASDSTNWTPLFLEIDTQRPTIRPSLLLDFANTKALDPRITYSRASTGTYYDGKTTVVAEQNLIVQSQAFNNVSWTANNATVSDNSTTAPDGATTGATISFAGGGVPCFIQETVATTGVSTISFYAKKGTTNYIQWLGGVSGNNYANFDLTLGVAGTFGSNVTSTSITAVGTWYRCTVLMSTVIAQFKIAGVDSASAAYAANLTTAGTIFLWGAQLEQRSTATSYTPTTTAPITNYIPVLQTAAAGVARFDHDPITGESKGFLIEEQRSNLVTYSDDINNAIWVKSDVAVVSNTIVSADGSLTGDKVYESATTANHRTDQTVAVTSGTTYTFSVFAKKAERQVVKLEMSGAAFSSASRVTFNLNTVTVQNSTGSPTYSSITSIGNGWYRCSVTSAATSTGNGRLWVMLGNSDSGEAGSYTGDGYSGLYIWGAQLEAGAFPTSYIPTVASQVTRSADAASMTGANFTSWYRADEGTVYIDQNTPYPPSSGDFKYSFQISDNSFNNRILSLTNSSQTLSAAVSANGQTSASFSVSSTIGNSKTAITYKANDFAGSFSGSAASTDSSGVVPIVSQLNIGSSHPPQNFLNGTIKRLVFYPARLSNTQLQAITS